MDNIYKNIEEYNPSKKRKMLIVFDDMITDILVIKNLIQYPASTRRPRDVRDLQGIFRRLSGDQHKN